MSAITNTALAQAMSDLIAHWQDFQDEHQAWLAGVVGGGPNNDGKYPLTDYEDNTVLVTCPAQLEADVEDIIDGANGYADAASASATAAAASASSASSSASTATTQASAATSAKTAAEAAQSAAESARATAIAQASTATSAAAAASASETAAETAETNAETAQAAAEAAQAAAEAAAAAAELFDPSNYGALADDETVSGAWSFSGRATFTASGVTGALGAVNITAGTPVLLLRESGAAANNRTWDFLSASEQLIFRTSNDAYNAFGTWLTVDRTDVTIDSISLFASEFSLNAGAAVGLPQIRSYALTLADDASGSVTVPQYGTIFVTSSFNSSADIVASFALTNTPVSIYTGAGAVIGNGSNPDTDTLANYWKSSSTTFNIKNRLGSTRSFRVFVLGGG